jgi:hypothetical protein
MSNVVGSQIVSRHDIPERDYLQSLGDLIRLPTNSTRTHAAVAGVALIETLGGSDNDQITYHTAGQVDLSAAGPNGRIKVRIKPDEVDTNEQDWFVGLSSGLSTATGTISNTVEQLTSGDHIGLFKKANALNLFYIAAANATHSAAVDTGVDVVDNTEYVFEIRWQAKTEGMSVQMFMNDVELISLTGIAYTNFGTMFAGVAMKTDDGNAEIITLSELLVGNKHR